MLFRNSFSKKIDNRNILKKFWTFIPKHKTFLEIAKHFLKMQAFFQFWAHFLLWTLLENTKEIKKFKKINKYQTAF